MDLEDRLFELKVLQPLGDSVDRYFYVKLVGVSHLNPDRTSRKKVIKTLIQGQELKLRRESTNIYDPNAILVCTEDGRGAGYLDARLAGDVTRSMKQDVRWRSYVRRVLHEDGTTHWGVVVCMVRYNKLTDNASSTPGLSGPEFLAKHYPDYKRIEPQAPLETLPRWAVLTIAGLLLLALVIAIHSC